MADFQRNAIGIKMTKDDFSPQSSDEIDPDELAAWLSGKPPDEVIKILISEIDTPARAIRSYIEAINRYSDANLLPLKGFREPQVTVGYLTNRIVESTEDIIKTLEIAAAYVIARAKSDADET